MNVFHFSGGRSSAYMVLLNYKPGDIVIFCDTGREDPDTYRFVKEFSEHENIPIVSLTGDWRKEVILKDQMIPNKFKRNCTRNLKIRKARRYLRSIGLFKYTQFIGFRYDEPVRVKEYKERWQQVKTVFPLHRDKINKPEIILFFKSKPYDLTIPAILGNCDLCFLKGEAAVISIIKDKPARADKWIEDEENKELNPKGYTYHKGKTMRQLRDAAMSIKTLFPLDDLQPKFNCSCTS